MNFSGLVQFEGRWVRVQDPVRVITAVSPEELIPALEEIETAVKILEEFANSHFATEEKYMLKYKNRDCHGKRRQTGVKKS